MGRADNRKKDKKVRKTAKKMLTDEQLERVKTSTINEEVVARVDRAWDRISDGFLEAMKNNRIGEDRRNLIIKEMAAIVAAVKMEEMNYGK